MTSVPAAVQVATVPALPKSTSSGWASTHSARSTWSAGRRGRGAVTRRGLGGFPGSPQPGELVGVAEDEDLLDAALGDHQGHRHERALRHRGHDPELAVDLG